MSAKHTTPHDPAPRGGVPGAHGDGTEPAWGGAAEEFPPRYDEFVAARSRYFARTKGRRHESGAPATRRAARGPSGEEARRWAV